MKKKNTTAISKKVVLGILLMSGWINNQATPTSKVISWQFATKGKIYATPLIHENVVYIGSLDSNFYALNASTGEEVWHYKTQNQIFSSAAIYDSIICFESGDVLYGLNLNGDFKWQYKMYDGTVTNQIDEWDCFHSSPNIIDSIAYIGTEKGLVYGINVVRGIKVFKCQTPTKDYAIHVKPVIYNGKILFGDMNGAFYAYSLTDTSKVWVYDTKNDGTYSWLNSIVTNPVIYNNCVYFGGRSCKLYCLNPETGSKYWSFNDPGSMWLLGGPTIKDSIIYLGSSYQKFVQAINSNTGKRIWVTNVGNLEYSNPFMEGDYIYVGTADDQTQKNGSLIAINKESGEIKNKFDFNGQVHSSPIIVNNLVYFGCTDGNVYTLNRDSFLIHEWPNTIIKDKSILEMGEIDSTESNVETSLCFIYNIGTAEDSITFVHSKFYKITPDTFNLAPGDSQQISLNLNASLFKSGDHTLTVFFAANKGMLPKQLNKQIHFFNRGLSVEVREPLQTKTYFESYPNPASTSVNFKFNLTNFCHAELRICDVLGNTVAIPVNEIKAPGNYNISVNVSRFQPGIYFYSFSAGSYSSFRKLEILH